MDGQKTSGWRRVSGAFLVVGAAIAALVTIFALSGPADGPRLNTLADMFGFDPAAFRRAGAAGLAAMAAEFPTLASYALVHVSWLHLASNALMIAVFGVAAMVRLGQAWRFLALVALASAGGALMFGAFHADDGAVLVGASGAASGLIGAFVRYGFQPRAFTARAPALAPVLGIATIVWSAIIIILMVVIGRLEPVLTGASGRVAFEAHVGGFLAGMLSMTLLDRRRR